MEKYNSGNPLSNLVKKHGNVIKASELKIGDIVYSEWYGDNVGGRGTPHNRRHIYLVTHTYFSHSLDITFIHLNGNRLGSLGGYQEKYEAVSGGQCSFDVQKNLHMNGFKKYWIVDHRPDLVSVTEFRPFNPNPKDPAYSAG